MLKKKDTKSNPNGNVAPATMACIPITLAYTLRSTFLIIHPSLLAPQIDTVLPIPNRLSRNNM